MTLAGAGDFQRKSENFQNTVKKSHRFREILEKKVKVDKAVIVVVQKFYLRALNHTAIFTH